ncbi:MAG: hypothetical protein Q8R43_01110 [Alphaproteobacteria bacterium]|nr:hypothetical protein [Alphaproteobacteria bacterium]
MTKNILDMCAYAYIEYYRSQFKKYAWAVDYAENLIQTTPQAGLAFVFEVLSICQNEQEIAYVASGVLEDLLHRHIFQIKEAVEMEFQENEALRVSMRYVWAESNSPVSLFLKDINVKFTAKTTEKHSLNIDSIKSTAVDE